MQDIKGYLEEEIHKLEIVIREAQYRIKRAPQGALRIVKKNYGLEYYLKEDGTNRNNGKYIKKKDAEIAYRLAQRDYDAQIIKLAGDRMRLIKRFVKAYEATDLRNVYRKTSIYRRTLLRDAIISDDEYIKHWIAVEYEGKSFAKDMPEIFTEKGERVRSKSEKIIADKLYSLGIPYRYEFPLMLDGNASVYPDFTILKMPEKKEVYLEHLGMLDNENYVEMMVNKLDMYARNGIYIGVNLFLTHESSKRPLNTKALDRQIKEIFCSL